MEVVMHHYVHLVLTIMKIDFTYALTCYTHTGNETARFDNATHWGYLCGFNVDTQRRRIDDEIIAIQTGTMYHCLQQYDNSIRCYCGTDLCNLHPPSPLPELIEHRLKKSINCTHYNAVDFDKDQKWENQSVCQGDYCSVWIKRQTGPPSRTCLDAVIIGLKNTCQKLPESADQPYSEICICNTEMCDPLKPPNDDQPEQADATNSVKSGTQVSAKMANPAFVVLLVFRLITMQYN